MGSQRAPNGYQALAASLSRSCNNRQQLAFFTFPHQDVTLATPLCQQERPGCVGGSRVCKHQAWAVWQRQEFAWRGSKRVCLAGKGGERRRREKGSQLLAPEWLFLARLSDCYRCAHSWVSPPGSVKPQQAERWEVLADGFFLVLVAVGGSLPGVALKV